MTFNEWWKLLNDWTGPYTEAERNMAQQGWNMGRFYLRESLEGKTGDYAALLRRSIPGEMLE